MWRLHSPDTLLDMIRVRIIPTQLSLLPQIVVKILKLDPSNEWFQHEAHELRCLVINSVIAGFLACGCVLAAIGGYWINFLIDIGILSVLILTISNHLSYFKKHYDEVY